MIIVKLKKIETIKDIIELGLPVKLFTIVKKEGGKELEIYFDSNNEVLVEEAMNIIKPYFKNYKRTKKEKKTKKSVLKTMGLIE